MKTPIFILTCLFFLFCTPARCGQNNIFDPAYAAIAAKNYDRAINLADSLLLQVQDDQSGTCHYILGFSYERKSELGIAMKHYLEAISLFQDNKDKARVINNVGNILMQHDLSSQSLGYFNSLIDAEVMDSLSLTYAYYNRAKAHMKLRMFEKSSDDIEQAIQLAQRMGKTALWLQAINRAGLIEREAGNLLTSKNHHLFLIDRFKEKSSDQPLFESYRRQARRATHNLARFYLLQQDTLNALAFFEQAVAISKHDHELFESKKDWGEILLATGENEKAKSLLHDALAHSNAAFLLRETEHIKIYALSAKVAAMDDQVALLEKGFNLMAQYSQNKDDLIQLHKQHEVVLVLNAHNQEIEAGERYDLVWRGLIALISIGLLIAVLTIIWLMRRNRQLSKDLNLILQKITNPSSL